MNWFILSYLALFFIGLIAFSYPYFDQSESIFSHINVAREIQENCEPINQVGIARDGHIVAIYECEEHYR